jgi:predicted nucleic acid-binding protein
MATGENLAPPRVYFDANVIISGCRTVNSASYVLIRLADYRLITGRTSDLALIETRRHLESVPPAALHEFRQVENNVFHAPDTAPNSSELSHLVGQADPKDLPHLASAIAQGCRYLVTFNGRHFRPSGPAPEILTPGELLEIFRAILSRYAS